MDFIGVHCFEAPFRPFYKDINGLKCRFAVTFEELEGKITSSTFWGDYVKHAGLSCRL